MAVKPSRSEIESALAARIKPRSRRKSKQSRANDRLLEATKNRKQYVIGGSFEGVSDYQKKRLRFGNLSSINYLNWIASAIVLMIVAVFFWPQANEKSITKISNFEQPTGRSAYSMESRVDEIQNTTPDQTFMRETDIKRANSFRDQDERELRTRTLLISAQAHIDKGEYLTPINNNAIANYKAVLRMDPRNFKAREGVEFINDRFLSNAYSALEDGNTNLATNLLQKLKSIDRESEASLEFTKALSDWQQNRQITLLLSKAELAQQEDKMILPARDNALYYFQEVLDINESNEQAIGGILGVAAYYIDKANTAIIAGHFESANNHVITITGIEAEHPSIPILKKKISDAEAKVSKKRTRSNSTRTTAKNTVNETNSTIRKSTPSSTQSVFSSNRTPNKEAAEQAAFDRQYLQRGLEAYYQANYETAAALLQPLADKGVSRAQFRIGYMYYLGRHFKKDRKEADRVIRAAIPAIQQFADEGRAWAQSDLGSLYEDGLVLPKDYDEANYWYRASAEQGYPGAQTNLGIMYARGRGVSSNRRTAIEWFQRASKQGDIAAKRNLEAMGVKP